jgi:hypothetical protein
MNERQQCPECRFDLKADDTACPFCGVALKTAPRPSVASRGGNRGSALKDCPDCGGTVSARAESCPHCGCPPQGKRRPMRPTGRVLVSAMIGAFALIVFLNVAMAGRRGAKVPLLSSPRLAPGDRAVLACKGGDGAYVAFGIKAWSRMAHAQVRRDTAEMERLVKEGQIALVADGTPLQVVSTGTMMHQLRVLAGPHEGREAWVRKEFVRPARR